MKHASVHRYLPSILLIALIVAAVLAYLPGLTGEFLFDDFVNLNALGAYGKVDNWQAFWRYITSGTADPTGRPLALLTFLIDANDWPADPYPFKRTSLILHLLNGVMLYTLLRQLGTIALADRRHATYAALLGTACWLLHPLFVSTTLYVVQREAMLPATFTLLGLIAYVVGRERLSAGRSLAGAAWMIAGIGAGTTLAILSKANGILLPLLALCIEAVLLGPRLPAGNARLLQLLRWALLYLPSLLLVAYLVLSIPVAIAHAARARPWSLGERVLTEGRILFQYVALLLVPRPFSTGLFNDNIVVSTSLLTPWTTLPAVVGAIALPIAAWIWRRRAPLVALAILFFAAGHLLESTVIALELYFEHRNYLPALLLFWPIAVALTGPGRWPAARRITAVALPLLLALMTHAHAKLWGNGLELSLVWAALSPDSPRAQSNAAQYEMAEGATDAAAERLKQALTQHPGELQLALNLLGAHCRLGDLRPEHVASIRQTLTEARYGLQLTFTWLDRMVEPVARGECQGLDLPTLESFVLIARANPRLNNAPGRAQELEHILGRIALLRGDARGALSHFDLGLAAEPRTGVALKQAALLGGTGHPRQGLAHLDRYVQLRDQIARPESGMRRLHSWVIARQGYEENEYTRLRATLEADAALEPQPAKTDDTTAPSESTPP